MKKTKSMLGILALLLVFAFTACDNGTTGNDDFHFANTSWGNDNTVIHFTSATEWRGEVNPDLRGTFRVDGNVAHLTVAYKNDSQVNGTGTVTIRHVGDIVIVIIVITVGELEIDEEAGQVPNDSTSPRLQGSWTDGINNWFILTGNQGAVFDNNVHRATFRTSFSEPNELAGIDVNVELVTLGITSPDNIILFELSFFNWEDAEPVGKVYGFWVNVDGDPFNQRFVITNRIVEPHALSSYIPNIGVYHRGTP